MHKRSLHIHTLTHASLLHLFYRRVLGLFCPNKMLCICPCGLVWVRNGFVRFLYGFCTGNPWICADSVRVPYGFCTGNFGSCSSARSCFVHVLIRVHLIMLKDLNNRLKEQRYS